tara:strand:- start:2956 stop:3231 length:276 start_codon:yes stop_codon:yes gene_type:complete
MTEEFELAVFGEMRWWQWHLGDRMANHQHPTEDVAGCSWPECAWHGLRPGDDNQSSSLPSVPLRSAALSHLDSIADGEGTFVYERDVELDG